MGNSLIVVEHDEDTIKSADFIVDVGPFAGVHGGEIVASGSVEDIKNCKNSITGKFLSGEEKIEVPKERVKPSGYLVIKGANENNLKNINVKMPLGNLTVVTGVSGSGKSSLVNGIVYPYLSGKINGRIFNKVNFKSFEGDEQIDKVILIDQSPIGRTPRSNPATYTEFLLQYEIFLPPLNLQKQEVTLLVDLVLIYVAEDVKPVKEPGKKR